MSEREGGLAAGMAFEYALDEIARMVGTTLDESAAEEIVEAVRSRLVPRDAGRDVVVLGREDAEWAHMMSLWARDHTVGESPEAREVRKEHASRAARLRSALASAQGNEEGRWAGSVEQETKGESK